MKEIIVEARVGYEVYIEINIKIMIEKRVKSKKAPIDRKKGEILKCNICGTIIHYVRDCPDYVPAKVS